MSIVHVGIDARCLNTTHVRGMGKYVADMLSHIPDSDHLQWTLFGDRPEAPFHPPPGIQARTDIFDLKGYRFHTWEQLGLPWHALRAEVQVLHCTATTLPFWQPVPTIVTVHDTLPWACNDSRHRGPYFDRLVPAALRKCWGIITISEQSRRDIIGLWPSVERKLHLILHGVADAYLDGKRSTLSESLAGELGATPYLLYIGGDVPRKRLDWAVRVFERLEASHLQLAVCGYSADGARRARDKLPEALRGKVRFLPFVSESDMPALYQNAIAVLYPTLYEGFGFPAVEAQALGIPVLFSAVGSLKELRGPAAEVLPPDDLDAWVSTTRRLIGERGESRVLNESARAWARRFSWSVSARRHAELYRAAAAHRSCVSQEAILERTDAR
jgi:glycosyltransferase involved in cell wall biosynthesis